MLAVMHNEWVTRFYYVRCSSHCSSHCLIDWCSLDFIVKPICQCCLCESRHNIDDLMPAGEDPPSSNRDRLRDDVFNVSDDKTHCICTRQLLPQLGRILLAQTGILIPVWARRIPVSVPSHLQLGGTLVPRSTRHCLPPPPQLNICHSPSIYNQLIV